MLFLTYFCKIFKDLVKCDDWSTLCQPGAGVLRDLCGALNICNPFWPSGRRSEVTLLWMMQLSWTAWMASRPLTCFKSSPSWCTPVWLFLNPHLFLSFQVFHNCSCVKVLEGSSRHSSAVVGPCQKGNECPKMFLYFLVVSVITSYTLSIGGTPGYILLLR